MGTRYATDNHTQQPTKTGFEQSDGSKVKSEVVYKILANSKWVTKIFQKLGRPQMEYLHHKRLLFCWIWKHPKNGINHFEFHPVPLQVNAKTRKTLAQSLLPYWTSAEPGSRRRWRWRKTRLNPVFWGAFFFPFLTLGYFRPFFFQAQPARSQAMPAAPIRWAMPWCDPVGPVWWYKNLPWPRLGCLVKFNDV